MKITVAFFSQRFFSAIFYWQSPKSPFLVCKEVLIWKLAVLSCCPRAFFYNAKVEMVSWNCLLSSQVLVFGCCSLVKPSACGPPTPFGPSKLESFLHLKVVLWTGDFTTGEYWCYLTSPYYTHWAVCSLLVSRLFPKSANKCNRRFLKLVKHKEANILNSVISLMQIKVIFSPQFQRPR